MILHTPPTPDVTLSPLTNAARQAVFARAAYRSAPLARAFIDESARRLDWTVTSWETENAAGVLVVFGDDEDRQAIVAVATARALSKESPRVPLLACPAVEPWFLLRTTGQASSGTLPQEKWDSHRDNKRFT